VYYYKCVKTLAFWWPFKWYFKIYRTEDLDDMNNPVWENRLDGIKPYVWASHFANKEVYNAYNSWYLRAGIKKSQEVRFEAYTVPYFDRFKLLFRAIFKKNKKKIDIGYKEKSIEAEKMKAKEVFRQEKKIVVE
jgi:hypothetical protein